MPTILDGIILTVSDFAGDKTLKFSISLTEIEDLSERFSSNPDGRACRFDSFLTSTPDSCRTLGNSDYAVMSISIAFRSAMNIFDINAPIETQSMTSSVTSIWMKLLLRRWKMSLWILPGWKPSSNLSFQCGNTKWNQDFFCFDTHARTR